MSIALEDIVDLNSTTPLITGTIDQIRFIVINRPEARNALTRDMRREFAQLVAEADADQAVSAIVLTGAGNVFTAGVDIKESRNGPPQPIVRPHPGEVLRGVKKPVIAAVNGPCVTGGLEMALSCDFIIASEHATFADTHAKVGLVPAWGLSALLPRAIGRQRALQMTMTGQFISSKIAYDWGLVNELVPAQDLIQHILMVLKAMQSVNRDSIMWQKELIRCQEGQSLDAALLAEEKMVQLWRSRPTA